MGSWPGVLTLCSDRRRRRALHRMWESKRAEQWTKGLEGMCLASALSCGGRVGGGWIGQVPKQAQTFMHVPAGSWQGQRTWPRKKQGDIEIILERSLRFASVPRTSEEQFTSVWSGTQRARVKDACQRRGGEWKGVVFAPFRPGP